MAFLETPIFPENISYGSVGGPGFSTTVIRMRSGHERRIINWSQSRYSYDAAYAIQDDVIMRELIAFFQVAEGKANGFRFKDHLEYDNKNTYYGDNWMYMGQATGASPGPYQITKYYKPGTVTTTAVKTRAIRKPRNTGAWRIGTGGVDQAGGAPTLLTLEEGTDFTINYTTGELTFTTTPPSVAMWWKGEFDVPCRFDIDELPITLEAFQSNTAQVPILETRQDT